MNPVQSQLSAELHEAVRKCDCAGAIGKIETLRNERRYHIHSFQGLDLGALYRVVARYTDTTIEVETAGNGTDRHVVVSKETAELLQSAAGPASSWVTMRNALALLMALVSLLNLCLESGAVSAVLAWLLGWHAASGTPSSSAAAAAAAAKSNATPAPAPDGGGSGGKSAPGKSGFSIF